MIVTNDETLARELRTMRNWGDMTSEYGLRDVSTPVHINRALREYGLIAVREEMGRELHPELGIVRGDFQAGTVLGLTELVALPAI